MKHTSFATAVGLCLCWTAIAFAQTQPSSRPTTSPTGELSAADLLTAIEINDGDDAVNATLEFHKTIQDKVHDKPKVLWEKIAGAYVKDSHAAGIHFSALRELTGLLEYPHQRTFSEARDSQWTSVDNGFPVKRTAQRSDFIVNYPDPTKAPVVDGKLLKQCVIEVIIDTQSKYFAGMNRLPEGDEFYDNPPLTIVRALWRGIGDPIHGGASGNLGLQIIGGKAPLASTVSVGGRVLKRSGLTPEQGALPALDETTFADGSGFACIAQVVDATGTAAAVRFDVPGVIGSYAYERVPFIDLASSDEKLIPMYPTQPIAGDAARGGTVAVGAGAPAGVSDKPATPAVPAVPPKNVSDPTAGFRVTYPGDLQASAVRPPMRWNYARPSARNPRNAQCIMLMARDRDGFESLQRDIARSQADSRRYMPDCSFTQPRPAKLGQFDAQVFDVTGTLNGSPIHQRVFALFRHGAYVELSVMARQADFDEWMAQMQPVIDSAKSTMRDGD